MTPIINYPSLVSVLGEASPQLMVYGFAGCKYQEIISTLRTSTPFGAGIENPIQRVFDYHIANTYLMESPETSSTLEGRKIHKIKCQDNQASKCKAALVNIIIETVKRQRAGLQLIPVLFTIDTSDGAEFYPSISDLITNKDKVTLKELRRVYKLCTDPALPEEVRDVAERTFKFVKVLVSNSSTDVIRASAAATAGTPIFTFESIKAPWLQVPKEKLDAAVAEYRATAKVIPLHKQHLQEEKTANGCHFRPQLLQAIEDP
ncbi:MAG: hypothetical protein NTX49_07705 [Chlamydiae bacterium]|nr:hypothetical protein [Chlamydiota bacterium]